MRQFTIWMNVTTSVNWHRPVVGIVRVEKLLTVELRKVFGPRLKECYWDVDQFVERGTCERSHYADGSLPTAAESPVYKKQGTPLRKGRYNRVKRFVSLLAEKRVRFDPHEGLGEAVPEAPSGGLTKKSPFTPGDVLVTVGLDWEYPYHKNFYALRIEQEVRIITCCHDLIPILYPQYCVGNVASRFKEYLQDIAMGSDAILCVSKQSEVDLTKSLSEMGARVPRTCVITHGDNVPTAMGDISQQIVETAKGRFLLYVSTIERRKNHEVLYQAYHLLCEDGKREGLPQLVFVGMPGWGTGDFLKDIELDPLTMGLIVQFNNVNDAELRLLYQAALFCVYPSFYEGWGLPVGEALALGKVVVSSNRGSLPEVGGDLVRYVDPWNPVAWANEIWNLCSNSNEIEAMAARIRSNYKVRDWAQTAETVIDLINRIVAGTP